jgi:hypothetical protein
MKQLQARFCLALIDEIEALSKQMFCQFHHAIHKEQFAIFVCHGIQNSFVCATLITIEPILCIVYIYGQ